MVDTSARDTPISDREALVSAFFQAPAIIIVTDADGRISHVNAHFTTATGYQSAEAVGRTPRFLSSSIGNDIGYDGLWRILVAEGSWRGELLNRGKDGSLFRVMTSIALLRDEAGSGRGYVWVQNDIGDRVAIEESLKESESRKQAIIEAAEEGLVLVDNNGICREINTAGARRLGLRPIDVVGRDIFQPFPSGMGWPRGSTLAKVARTGLPVYREDRADGRIFENAFHPVFDASRRMTAISVVSRDVTARRHAEEERRAGEERYRTIVETAREGIMQTDAAGRIVFANSRMGGMLGCSSSSIIGLRVQEFMGREARKQAILRLRRLRKGLPGVDEIQLVRQDGSPFWVQVSSSPLIGDDGGFQGVFGMFSDITERMEAEKNRLETERRLHQSRKMEALGQMAGGMAHEFNNILVPMIGLTEVVYDGLPPDGDQRRNLQTVLAAGKRAADLIRKMLAFTRVDSAGSDMILLGSVVDDALVLLRAGLPSSIRLEIHISERPLPIMSDPTDIHQIMMNLGANARDAIGAERQGRIRVDVKTRRIDARAETMAGTLEPGSYACIRFQDDGAGMDEPTLTRAFEPFFTTKPVGQGTGMGLAVVLGLVKRHRGGLFSSSRPGRGTIFEIMFPMVKKVKGKER